MRRFAVGIVCKNRWDLTLKTLQSIYHTDQSKDSFDLYLIDNGSNDKVGEELKEWIKSAIVPVKNLIRTKELPLAAAWNLFLAVTSHYQYRTKLDNDLIFANTPVALEPFKKARGVPRAPSPGDFGTNPGAVQVASFTMGAGNNVSNTHAPIHTRFLQHLEDAMHNSKLGISSLPPVSVGGTLPASMPGIAKTQWRGKPLLMGACMMIEKNTFDRLGYFDERLPMHIDWEYSQRAMGAGINVGYVPDYCVIHIGEKEPTLDAAVVQQQELDAKQIGSQIEFKRDFVHSKWEAVSTKILKAANKSTVVNLT